CTFLLDVVVSEFVASTLSAFASVATSASRKKWKTSRFSESSPESRKANHLHFSSSLDGNHATGLSHRLVGYHLPGGAAERNGAWDAVALHPCGSIDGVSPQVEEILSLSHHTGHHRADVNAHA